MKDDDDDGGENPPPEQRSEDGAMGAVDDCGGDNPPPEQRSEDGAQSAVDEGPRPDTADADDGKPTTLDTDEVPAAPDAGEIRATNRSSQDPSPRPTARPRRSERHLPHTYESKRIDLFFESASVDPHAADPRSIVKPSEIARPGEIGIVLEWMLGERGDKPPTQIARFQNRPDLRSPENFDKLIRLLAAERGGEPVVRQPW